MRREVLKVNDFADVYSGGTPSTKVSGYWSGDLAWITPKDLSTHSGVYIKTGARSITQDGLANSSATLVPRDTIVLSTRAPIGYLAIAEEPLATNQGCKNLKCKTNIAHPLFIYYLLKGSTKRLEAHATGATFKELSSTRLKKITFELPNITLQESIASTLYMYDNMIENNKRRIQLLEYAARLLYKEWFVHFRFPGHEHVKIEDGMPEGWEKVSVPEIIEINPKEQIIESSNIRYVPMSSLSESGMLVDISGLEIRHKATSVKFRNGDVLFARITPCLENGKTGFVNFLDDQEVATGSTELIILRGRSVSPFFVYCLAHTHDFRENAIKSMIGSSGRQRVQTNCFDRVVLGLPTKQILMQFDDIAKTYFSQIGCLMHQNERLSRALSLLLPRLMNGEIAV